MKIDRSNTFDLCYYGQVNSLRLKSSVASRWACENIWQMKKQTKKWLVSIAILSEFSARIELLVT